MLNIVRWASLTMVVGLLVLMLGPFQRIEQDSGISDKLAHVGAFGVVVTALMLNCPRFGRLSVAGLAFLLAVMVEVAQSIVGRDAELGDILAGSIGIAIVSALWFPRKLF